MNRRRFIGSSFAAAAVSAVSSLAGESSTLPQSIAALSPMRDQVRPITNDERRTRIRRARELMVRQKIGALVLTPGTSLQYFTSIRWSGGERLFACVIAAKGEPFFVCPAFEEDRAREQISLGPFGSDRADVRTWQEDESPYALVARGLRDRGAATASVALDENARFIWSERLAAAAPRAHFVSGIPVTAGCRMIKDGHEIELMQIASNATLKAYEAVYRALHPGLTQDDVSDLIERAHERLGFSGQASVQTGEFTALPHGSAKAQIIREGTVIMVDGGCSVEGYQSDLTRTFVIGKAGDKAKRVFEIVKHAQSAALAAARPGVPLASVDDAARRVIADAGYGPGFKYFTHRVGHGIGLDGHEWPYLVKNDMFGWPDTPRAQAGMTFSDEPGIYIRGEFGVRLEDDMVITSDGARLFTPPSQSLEEPF